MTITQWSLADRWIMKRFLIMGEGEDGPLELKGRAKLLDFKAEHSPSAFALDATKVQGYQKMGGT